jgi:hypothetical protein
MKMGLERLERGKYSADRDIFFKSNGQELGIL